MPLAGLRFEFAGTIYGRRIARGARTRFSGLWVEGDLAALERITVAVVGARTPSDAARVHAERLGEALARAGICVLSGLAVGIDAAAHLGAIAGGTPTIGVLGGGHRCFFPKRNRELGARIVAEGGAVLSPFGPDEPARPAHFLQRNGVVAALADAVVVVEAAGRSGALNTAGWAADLGIDVLAYPGDVDRPKAAGCNALIRDGATLVRGPADVLEAVGVAAPAPTSRAAFDRALSPTERRVLDCLANGPLPIDDMTSAGEDVSAIAAALVTLELSGAIRRDPHAATYERS